MIIDYLSSYLVFIICFALVGGIILLKLRVTKARVFLLFGAVIIFIPAILGYFYVTYFAAVSEVRVPNLTGLPIEEALVKLASLELKGRYAGSVFDMNLPEGQVVSQRPEAGRKVKVGRMVYLLASSGKRKVLAPNLLGRLAVQAEAVLAAKGLFLGEKKEEAIGQLNPGIILTQDPLPGEEVEVGSAVAITVSTSVEEVTLSQGATKESETKKEGWFW